MKRLYLYVLSFIGICIGALYLVDAPELSLAGTHHTASVIMQRDDLERIANDPDDTLYDMLYWYQAFPMLGLRLEQPYWPPAYPFIPHYFSLWDLAPHQGAGTTVVVLDNGVAGVHDCAGELPRHPDIALCADNITHRSDLVLSNTTCIDIESPVSAHVMNHNVPVPRGGVIQERHPGFHHGSHVYSLIAGTAHRDRVPVHGLCGLAPRAKTMALKICNERGTGRFSTLCKGIKKAVSYHADIINVSLACSSLYDLTATSSHKTNALETDAYTVVAVGNKKPCSSTMLSRTTITVGAYGIDRNHAFIPSFSQYIPQVSPSFVAPGYNILGPYVSSRRPGYMLHHGTSLSAALMSGFLALIRGEFGSLFGYDEVMDVLRACSFKMHDTPDWNTRVVHGAVDMRMALFMLHIIQRVGHRMKHVPFSALVGIIRKRLLHDPYEYAIKNRSSLDFVTCFMDYYTWASSVPHKPVVLYQRTESKVAIHDIVQTILSTSTLY